MDPGFLSTFALFTFIFYICRSVVRYWSHVFGFSLSDYGLNFLETNSKASESLQPPVRGAAERRVAAQEPQRSWKSCVCCCLTRH